MALVDVITTAIRGLAEISQGGGPEAKAADQLLFSLQYTGPKFSKGLIEMAYRAANVAPPKGP
jgi:hypothetical protein